MGVLEKLNKLANNDILIGWVPETGRSGININEEADAC